MKFVTLSVSNIQSLHTHPLSQDCIHSSAPSALIFSLNVWPLLLHEQHEGIWRLLNIRLKIRLLVCTPSLSTGQKQSESLCYHCGNIKMSRIIQDV